MNGQHTWVKHTVTPISVISNPYSEEGFIALDMPDTQAVSEVYGCTVCLIPLNHDTVNTLCEGEEASGSAG